MGNWDAFDVFSSKTEVHPPVSNNESPEEKSKFETKLKNFTKADINALLVFKDKYDGGNTSKSNGVFRNKKKCQMNFKLIDMDTLASYSQIKCNLSEVLLIYKFLETLPYIFSHLRLDDDDDDEWIYSISEKQVATEVFQERQAVGLLMYLMTGTRPDIV